MKKIDETLSSSIKLIIKVLKDSNIVKSARDLVVDNNAIFLFIYLLLYATEKIVLLLEKSVIIERQSFTQKVKLVDLTKKCKRK